MSRIDLVCNDGSPLGVTSKSITGEDGRFGVGGAELALLTMCEAWHKEGHEVRLYNSPDVPDGSPFEQFGVDEFDPKEDRDYLIVFRSPNHRIKNVKAKKVIWWSTDQNTIGDFAAFSKQVNTIVTISRFHSKYFKDVYGITDTVSIDLPVRTVEYKQQVEKVPLRCIYTSVPDRGVMVLHAAWPQIQKEVPEASLVITSDHRLWNKHLGYEVVMPYKLAYAQHENVKYLGAVTRKELVEEQLKAELYLYPCIYDELFCIAAAEAQTSGAFPITSVIGALNETNMGMVISGNPRDPKWVEIFVEKAVELLKNPDLLHSRQQRVKELAEKRFSVRRIVDEWNEKVFEL